MDAPKVEQDEFEEEELESGGDKENGELWSGGPTPGLGLCPCLYLVLLLLTMHVDSTIAPG